MCDTLLFLLVGITSWNYCNSLKGEKRKYVRIFISQSKKVVLRKDQRMSDKKQCEEADEWKKWCKKEERKENVLILKLCPRSGERCCATSTVEFGEWKGRRNNFSLSSYLLHFGVVENWCHAHSPTFLPVIPEEPKPPCLGSGQHWFTQHVPKPYSHPQGD